MIDDKKTGLADLQETPDQPLKPRAPLHEAVDQSLVRTKLWASMNARGVDLSSAKIQKRLNDLLDHIQRGEVAENYEFDIYAWHNYDRMKPGREMLTKKDVRNQVVILVLEEFEEIGGLKFIAANGKPSSLDRDNMPSDDIFILYPWELGDHA